MPRTFDEDGLKAHLEREMLRLRANMPDPTKCPRCQDTGMALVLGDGPVRQEYCGCPIGQMAQQQDRQRKLDKLFEDADIPTIYRQASMADLANLPAPVAKRIRSALAEGRGLVLWGKVDTGKTHAAVAILRDAMAGGQTGLLIKVPKLLTRIRRCFDQKVPIDSVVEPVQNCDLLVLDDWGVEADSPWVQETLYGIIDHRYSNDLRMILTTNLTETEMVERSGPRVCSRLRGCCRFVEFVGVKGWRR